ncbi:substrate-binding domain-containing protein [Nonomuraea thailandensis]
MSIVGYDDVPPAQDLHLTTVHLPHDELGRAAVRLALGRLTTSPLTLGTHIVVRDSVRPLGPR